MNLNLEEIRTKIDIVDKELVALLEERMSLVDMIAEYKRDNKIAVFDNKREEIVLEKVRKEVTNTDYLESILNTFRDIMKNSRNYQLEKIDL